MAPLPRTPRTSYRPSDLISPAFISPIGRDHTGAPGALVVPYCRSGALRGLQIAKVCANGRPAFANGGGPRREEDRTRLRRPGGPRAAAAARAHPAYRLRRG